MLVGFGAAIVVGAWGIPPGVQTDPLGPRAFPLALGVAIGLCGLLLAASAVGLRGGLDRAGVLADADPESDAEGPFSPGRLTAAVAVTALYLAAFERIGYLMTTPLYVAAVLLVHGGATRQALLATPLLTTIAFYAAFRFGLLIPVPVGVLEGILPW